jgi:hypothetical protein
LTLEKADELLKNLNIPSSLSPPPAPVSSENKKKGIIMFFNELQLQIQKECKERGKVLKKLWKAYFSQLKSENKFILTSKDTVIKELTARLKVMAEALEGKEKEVKRLQREAEVGEERIKVLNELVRYMEERYVEMEGKYEDA